MFERHYDLDGCVVRVRGVGDDLALVIDLLLGPYALGGPVGLPDILIDIERRSSEPDAPRGKPSFVFPPMAAHATSGGWWLTDDVAELDVRPRPVGSTIRGWLRSGAPLPLVSRFAGLSLWVALMECLRARGRYPLHGAALVSPAGETVLFAGTKGAGKSTITLALLEAGWSVVTDDTLFLERGAGGAVELIGYRKRFHVRPDLLERRPDLAPLARRPAPFEPQDKRWLTIGDRWPDRVRQRASAPVRVFFPEIIAAPRSRRIPLGSRETLLRLLADSAFVFVGADPAPGHLACLGALVDGAPGARLQCGRDVLADPSIYLELIDAARASREGEPWASSA